MPYEQIGRSEPVCIADEVSFEIPDSWEWTRISSIGSIVRGSGIKRTETVPEGMPCVRYGELYTTYQTSFTEAVSFVSDELFGRCKHISYGDILMSLTGENKPDIAKAVAYLGESKIAAGGDLAFWTAHGMNPLYLSYFMASPYAIERKVNLATGDIIVHISGDKLGTILIPIPPLSEQQRIVDKILEIESLLAEYAAKETAIDNLQESFPNQLKKSILQQAVQGKLVPQDLNDEPASVLLERIRAEKEQLIKDGKIKRDKHESVIYRRDNSHYENVDGVEHCIDDEIPFEIPESWEWCRLKTLAIKIGAGSTPTGGRAVYVDQGIKFIRSQNVYNDGLHLNGIAYISSETNQKKSGSIVRSKDILLNITGGSIGRCAIVPDEFDIGNVNQHVMIIRCAMPEIRHWIHTVLISEYIQAMIMDVQVGVSREGLSAAKLMDFLIPMPPSTEQIRIANSLSQMLPIIDHL